MIDDTKVIDNTYFVNGQLELLHENNQWAELSSASPRLLFEIINSNPPCNTIDD